MKRKIVLVALLLSIIQTLSFAKTYARLYSVRFNNTATSYGHGAFFHMPGADGIMDTNDDKCLLINGGGPRSGNHLEEFLNNYPWHGGKLGDADKKKINFFFMNAPSTDEIPAPARMFIDLNYDCDAMYENCDFTDKGNSDYDDIRSKFQSRIYAVDGGDVLSPPGQATKGNGWDPNIYCKVLCGRDGTYLGGDDNPWHNIFKVWISSWMNPNACSFTFGGDVSTTEENWVINNDATNAYATASSDAANTTIVWMHHHGSNGSNSANWFNLTKPKIVIQQDGGANTGHPFAEALRNATNSPNKPSIWRQDMDGTVEMVLDSEGNFNVSREYDNPPSPFPSCDWIDGNPPSLIDITGLAVLTHTGNSITLNWNDPNPDISYYVWRSTIQGGDTSGGSYTQEMDETTGIYVNITGTTPVSGPPYTDENLAEEFYYYRISGIWNFNEGAHHYPYERRYSNEVIGTTDMAAPEVITNLSALTGVYYGQVKLFWTAPTEDGTEGGKVSSYYLKYATFTLSDTTAWWNNYSSPASGEPTPGEPGTTSTMTVGNLMGGVTYYFGIKSSDGYYYSLIDTLSLSSATQAKALAKRDYTPPVFPEGAEVYDGNITGVDIDTFTSMTEISANWDVAVDTDSRIAKYWFAISSTAQGGTEFLDWQDNDSETSVTVLIELTDITTYWFSVRAENGQGLLSGTASSDGAFNVVPPYVVSLPKSRYKVAELPSVTFSEKISTDSINNMISLKVIRDNLGYVGTTVPGTVSYDAGAAKITFVPDSGGLESNFSYLLEISTDLTDLSGNEIIGDLSFKFLTLMNPAETNVVFASFDEDEKVCVEISSGAFSESAYIVISATDVSGLIPRLGPVDDSFCFPISQTGKNFTAYNGSDVKISGVNPFKRITITLSYGTLPVRVDTETLNVWYLDDDRNVLLKLPGSSIDTANKTVSADVYHLSSFVLAGESDTNLTDAYAYPVPYKPTDGKDETGTLDGGITFARLGSAAVIKIYTISGELVKTLYYTYSSGAHEKKWTVVNEDGKRAASGLYIYYISNGVEENHGNLIIIR